MTGLCYARRPIRTQYPIAIRLNQWLVSADISPAEITSLIEPSSCRASLEHAAGTKKSAAAAGKGRFAMNLIDRPCENAKRIGRPPVPEEPLVAEINQPSYGNRQANKV